MGENFEVDFIGIGAAKSGTTWLSNCLRAHPGICLSEPKEIRYFSRHSMLDYYHAITKGDKAALVEKPIKDLSWYAKHFRHCQPQQIKGEFSPEYLFDERAPSLIHQYFPKIKLIACLRNPIDRAYSHYWMYQASKREKRTFEDVIRKENIYIQMGFYSKQLKRYLNYFNRDQMLILIADDMLMNPRNELDKVLRFLNVDTNIKIDVMRVFSNSAKKNRSKWIYKGSYLISRGLINLNLSPFLSMFRKIGVHHLFTKLNAVKFKYPAMQSITRANLREVFKEDVKELEGLMDRDLSHWQ